MSEHDEIVKDLKEQLRSKGFKVMSFRKREGMISQIGYGTIKPKIAHVVFTPDIVFSENEKDEDRFFLEYIHTKNRKVHDVRGMIALSKEIKKARGFIVLFNDDIFVRSEGWKDEAHLVEYDKLSVFLNDLKKYSKEVFLRTLDR